MASNIEPIKPPRYYGRKHRGLAKENDPFSLPASYRKRYQKRNKRIAPKEPTKRLRKLLGL